MSAHREADPAVGRVPRARLLGQWDKVGLLHWEVHRATVARSLPDGYEVDTVGGAALVGIVSSTAVARPPWFVSVPGVSVFLETDVRTYVRGPDGEPGVWLLSVDVDRLAAFALCRTISGVPCHWSRLGVSVAGNVIVHETHRRGRAATGASVAIEIGDPIAQGELSALDRFLTERWTVSWRSRSGVSSLPVDHQPAPLHRAEVLQCEESLLVAVGLPSPPGKPVAHYSPGGAVRLGRRSRRVPGTSAAPWALHPGMAPPTPG